MRFALLCLLSFPYSFSLFAAEDMPISGQAVKEFLPFERCLMDFVQKHSLPGATVAVAKDGQLLYARGFGWADRKKHLPMQPDSLMRIASISKPITAAAILRLAEQGRLKLDDPVLPYLEKFKPHENIHFDDRWKQITLEHLLRHTAGFDRDVSFDPMFMPKRFIKDLGTPVDRPAIIRFMLNRPLDFDPGTRYAYSNFGYCVLGRVIEQVTGKPYDKAVSELVLKPAGITRMRLGKTRLADRAEGEVHYHMPEGAAGRKSVFPDDTKPIAGPYGPFYLEAMDAHGGWIASAADLIRFATALDGRRQPGLLKADSVKKIESPSNPPVYMKKGNYYGLGWMIYPQAIGNNWSHNGLLDGTRTILIRSHDGLVMTALFNGQPVREKSFHLELDQTLWKAIGQVVTWPKEDLFRSP
jgi:CubicO group peptidase (beta-lactamase class C family)